MNKEKEAIATDGYKSVPFRMHPRVFAALGADLVTNDVVAVIELVKNSYDAFANNVWIRFGTDPTHGDFLEVEDDGQGMTRDVIENVWCVVATPFKIDNPLTLKGKKERRVAGEKGLGRFSIARLGTKLNMLTQAPNDECWEVDVNWDEVNSGTDISASAANYRKYPGDSPFKESGTRLRISGLDREWDEGRITDLEENLGRLISPFSDLGDFNIFIRGPGESGTEEVKIEAPDFLAKPKYKIEGGVDEEGNITCTYYFAPLYEGEPRTKELTLTWGQIYDNIQNRTSFRFNPEKLNCGPFTFEIRVWDIGAGDTQEIAEKFDLQKTQIRKAIRAHKGISVYRDRVLVLPKTDAGRDWLGLDLRRISRVGTRLSTTQIVGYVSISAEENPKIDDTSDRERLVSNREAAEFEELLKTVVSLLEGERDEDRIKREREKPLEDLFSSLTAEDMLAEVIALAEEGGEASEAVPILEAFNVKLDEARKAIQERFVYYSRLATVGTIALMLVHEIRNRTTAVGEFLDGVKSRFGPFKYKDIDVAYRSAVTAVDALERLADTFSPLASRSFRRRKRRAVLEERIRECFNLVSGEIKRKNIKYSIPGSETHVQVDPGELDTIILNLIENAAYWLSQVSKDNREIEFRLTTIHRGSRIRIWVHDTGPGIEEEDIERVFWPGVTRKPDGIGMGLTIASELVAEYGGRMFLKHPGTKGGASFAFDLPIK